MAQRLMLEYKFTEADLLDLTDASETATDDWLTADTGKFSKLRMSWKQRLANGIANLNSSAALIYPDQRMKLIGRESDRQVIEYFACYLIREIDRLA
jgi:hypothetical protein